MSVPTVYLKRRKGIVSVFGWQCVDVTQTNRDLAGINDTFGAYGIAPWPIATTMDRKSRTYLAFHGTVGETLWCDFIGRHTHPKVPPHYRKTTLEEARRYFPELEKQLSIETLQYQLETK